MWFDIRLYLPDTLKNILSYVTYIILEYIIVQDDIMYLFFAHPTAQKMPITLDRAQPVCGASGE